MKTIRIRSFLILALLLISTLPWMAFVIVHLILTKRLTFKPETQSQIQPYDAAATLPADVWAVLAVAFGLLLATLVIAIAMRRFMIKPLEAMRLAAKQIATGDLEVNDLAMSRITEIGEVRDGFEVMVDALQDAFHKQLVLEEERSFIINAVAHDLRTPLFALRGYLDGLEQAIVNTPDKMMMYVAVCKESSEQLDRLVSDLFTFTQLEYTGSDGFGIQVEGVDVADIVLKSVQSLRILAYESGISILVGGHSGPAYTRGDRYLLVRVVNNVVENAVRHTPEGGNIEIQCTAENGKVLVTVEDSGPGFAADDLRHVFEPLYRGDGSRNRATGGAGLGLTIAQRIVHRHGGDIWVGNSPAGGGSVTFWLPALNVPIN